MSICECHPPNNCGYSAKRILCIWSSYVEKKHSGMDVPECEINLRQNGVKHPTKSHSMESFEAESWTPFGQNLEVQWSDELLIYA